MMRYVTTEGLIKRYGRDELVQLTDRENIPPMEINEEVVERAIIDAGGRIDGYLGKVYKLPLTVVPDILSKVAADLARYYLHGDAAEKDTVVAINYRGSIDWLRDVSRGLVDLDIEGVKPAQSGTGAIKAKRSDRVFTRDSLKGA
ncbi:gp436 family protein [Aliihoeflea sp. PC F10.4]